MKKCCFVLSVLALLMSFSSCGTTDSLAYDAAIQKILQNEDAAVFTLGRTLILAGIDDMSSEDIDGFEEYSNHKTQIFTVTPGVHSVKVRYKNDKSSSLSTVALFAKFEKGMLYKVTCKVLSHKLYYDIVNEETSESVLLGVKILH